MKRLQAIATIQLMVLIVAGHYASAQKATVHDSPHKKLVRSCEKCHVATSFKDIRFDHDDTDFHLAGLHSGVACLACHSVEDFAKVDPSCATCHQDIHRGRLGIECSRCHTEHGWTVFDAEGIHESTNFPLQGRHLLVDCLSCHPGMPTADFRRAWTPCYQCHLQDYESTVSPDHRASGFSALCQTCHEMTGWTPSFMPDHDMFFPIFSGKHDLPRHSGQLQGVRVHHLPRTQSNRNGFQTPGDSGLCVQLAGVLPVSPHRRSRRLRRTRRVVFSGFFGCAQQPLGRLRRLSSHTRE